ncbi:MAG: hypothetical protein L0154_10260 [Chloroflexi bacterium]|nr:hypothetical protein [Chloroflexota bacterium]
MPVSSAPSKVDGSELIHVRSGRELAHLRELQIEICELNSFRLISLTRQRVNDGEYLFYFSASDEYTPTPDKNYTIPLTA